MKLIQHAAPPCNCYAKLLEYAGALGEGVQLGLGSIVECDCGKQYKLADDQRDGLDWHWHHPDYGDMSKR